MKVLAGLPWTTVVKAWVAVIQRFDKDLRVMYISPQAEKATGIPAKEFIGKTNEEMGMPPELCKVWNELFGKVRETKRLQNLAFDYPGVNGIETFSLDIVPEIDPDGSVKSFLGISTNITELKKGQDDLRRSNAELQQFAYVASHDLQEPLRMVISHLSLLNKKFGDTLDLRAKEYVSIAVAGGERMRVLVDDLL